MFSSSLLAKNHSILLLFLYAVDEWFEQCSRFFGRSLTAWIGKVVSAELRIELDD